MFRNKPKMDHVSAIGSAFTVLAPDMFAESVEMRSINLKGFVAGCNPYTHTHLAARMGRTLFLCVCVGRVCGPQHVKTILRAAAIKAR